MASLSPGTQPYLSVVAASRNDDHGGDPLIRTQIFVNCFARQCEKYRLPAELILVDWNPVEGRPGLAGVLQLPAGTSYCQARVITVPAPLHRRFKYADRLGFFQMIAKNAGIRRARGRFILATNIDIIFSDELVRHIARQELDPAKLVRVDRYDIQSGISPGSSLDEVLDYAWTHPVRSNVRFHPRTIVNHLYGDEPFRRHCRPDPAVANTPGHSVSQQAGIWTLQVQRDVPLAELHTNACGDFTLLSREAWNTITGYPEFEAFSMNIDSIGLAAAHYAGFTEVALLPPCVCFHIEHSLGSGWTPEGEKQLFARLNEKQILNPEWHVLTPLVDGMRDKSVPTALNGPEWGLARFELPEAPLLAGRMETGPIHPQPYAINDGVRVSALLPSFDLDRLSVWQDRLNNPADRLNAIITETREALTRTEHYLEEVAEDSANRLKSIHHYQDKLKQAYADHDHNVAFIEKQHAEIQKYVKIAAEHEAIIASLNEQLRVALQARSSK